MDRRSALTLLGNVVGMFGLSMVRVPAQSTDKRLEFSKGSGLTGVVATLSPEYEPAKKLKIGDSEVDVYSFRQPDYSKPQTLTLYLDKVNIVVDFGGNAKKISGRELFDAL